MKKLASILLALCLLFSACACAETVQTLSGCYGAVLLSTGDALAVRFEKGKQEYYITDLYGNKLNETAFVSAKSDNGFFNVQVDKNHDINHIGIVDAAGNVVVPCDYSGVEVLSDRWIIAKHSVPCDENNYDYRVSDGTNTSFAIIDRNDVYFRGTLVGSLGRTDYYYGYAYGDYLTVRSEAGDITAYNNRFEKSPLQIEYSSSEYEDVREDGKTVYYHVGSGQKAFCPECTLTPDEVEQYLMADRKYNYYDLQGNLAFSAGNVTYAAAFKSRYASAQANSGKGLLRNDGFFAIPCEYDSINYPTVYGDYMAVCKDGKLGYCDMNGNLVYLSNYPYSSFSVNNTFSAIKDLDGSIILVTPMGQIEQRFAGFRVSYNNVGALAAVKDMDGKVGVIDMSGNIIMPTAGCYRDVSDIVIADNGSAFTAYNYDTRTYEVYAVSAGEAVPATEPQPEAQPEVQPEAQPEVQPEAAATEEAQPAADGDTWFCPVCGRENDGNFCPEDGTKKPEPAGWVCPVCGSVNETNFCPKDGTKKPE